MTDMNDLDLRRLDMGLLLVFDATMRLRKLTAVAARIGQTQSSISHALGRLRDIFGDPLFLRRPDGVEPTVRALALAPRIAEILDLTRRALAPDEAFDPAYATGTVRIAAQDYHCTLFAAPLLTACESAAPGLRISFRPLARGAALAALDAGDVELSIGFLPRLEPRFIGSKLVEQGYAVIARKGHPRVRSAPSLDAYLTERHLLVSHRGDARGVVDTLLHQQGRTRTVAATIPYYLPARATVAATDFIATVPRLLAERHAGDYGLAVFDPPLAIRHFTISAVRHRRHAEDARLDWIVARLAQAAA